MKDIDKLDGKIYGPIEVVATTVHNTNDKVRKSLISTIVNILKTSPLFYIDEKKHLNFEKRKACEKLFDGIIDASPHLAMLLIELYKRSKKIFTHSINVAIIATVLESGIQENNKHLDGLRSEIILTGALLHDIAYLKMPETMINKRRIEYTEEEKKMYNDHPVLGKKIIESISGKFRSEVIKIISQHQERLNGSGFPNGLKDKEVYEPALLVGLADEFELTVSSEISNAKKGYSDIMSKMSHMGAYFGNWAVDSLYNCFRYLI